MKIIRSIFVQPVQSSTLLIGPFALSLNLIAFFQPWWLPNGLHFYDYQRWVEAFALTLSGFAFISIVAFRDALGKYIWLVALLTLLACISASVSSVGWISWVSTIRLILWSHVMLCIPFVFARLSKEQFSVLFASVTSALFIYAIYCVVGALALIKNGVYSRVFMVSGFANVNHAAGFLMLASLLMPMLSQEAGRFSRAFFFLGTFSASIFVFLLIVIGSRGSWMAGVGALLSLVAVFRGSESRRYLAQCIKYLLLGGIVFLLMQGLTIFQGIEYATSSKPITSDSGRLDLYLTAAEGVLERPWFGHGLLSFSANSNSLYGHPHNIILSSLYELGVPFTLLAILLLSFLGVKFIVDRGVIGEDFCSVGGLAVIVAFSVHSQFSGLSMIPATLVLFAFGGGLALRRLVQSLGCAHDRAGSNVKIAAFSGCSIAYLLMICLYWGGTSENVEQKTRFWLNGNTSPWLKSYQATE